MNTTYLKPLLPLRDIVIFPSMVVPLFVGREKSIKAFKTKLKKNSTILSTLLDRVFSRFKGDNNGS